MTDYALDRGLPASADAERAVLGAILLDATGGCYSQAAALLSADDFSLDSHRRIFRAMIALDETDSPMDYVTVCDELGRRREVESVGGVAYVTCLTDGLPRVKNIEQYVRIVRRLSQLRGVIHLSASLTERAYEGSEDAGDMILDAQQQLLDLYRRGAKPAPTLGDYVRQCINSMDEQQRRAADTSIGLTTGLKDLDDAITGYRKGLYYVIGGRPSSGKSSIALQSIRDNCKTGHRCGFFSVEMSGEDVFNRLASMETGIPVFALQDTRGLSTVESNRVKEAYAAIASWPFELRCGPLSIRELKATAKLLIAKGTEILYADYLQHPSLKVPGLKISQEFERVTEISSVLCDIGKSNNVPMVALSQLSRPDKRGPIREPRMDDLRQSGQIEQDSDVIVLLHRPQDEPGEDGRGRFTGLDKAIIEKQRNGPAGESLPVWFDGPACMYRPRDMRGFSARVPNYTEARQ